MKKILLILWLLSGINWAGYPNSASAHGRKPAFARSLSEQIAAYIIYPAVLQHHGKGGIAVIRFQLDANQRLTHIEVGNGIESFKNDLIRQLSGKKGISLPSGPATTLHGAAALPTAIGWLSPDGLRN